MRVPRARRMDDSLEDDSAKARVGERIVRHPAEEQLRVFISSTMSELRDVRDVLTDALKKRGIYAWVFETSAGARPGNVVETSLKEVESCDIYVGLFWKRYGEITVAEYDTARGAEKPCLIYIRDQGTRQERALEDFLDNEVYHLEKGVTYAFFQSPVRLCDQVAEDILAWLVRQHRELTAVVRAGRVSRVEAARLQADVIRLQASSSQPLPIGGEADFMAQQLEGWFRSLGYLFDPYQLSSPGCAEWALKIRSRGGYQWVLVRGITGEAEVRDVLALRHQVSSSKFQEGWLVAPRRKSQAACDEARRDPNTRLYVYIFDELIDETADFSSYFRWLQAELKNRHIEETYVPLACTKAELDAGTQELLGRSRYDERNGWIDGYVDRWLDDPSKEHLSILGEFGTGKTWFALHYAWTALQKYLDAKEKGLQRPRLPIYVPLRDYPRADSIVSLFSEFFFHKHGVTMPGYGVFEHLNRMGKLLLILDGFDEMAPRIDHDQMVAHFRELTRVVLPGAKVILTCRTEHFPSDREGRLILQAHPGTLRDRHTAQPPQFEILHQ